MLTGWKKGTGAPEGDPELRGTRLCVCVLIITVVTAK